MMLTDIIARFRLNSIVFLTLLLVSLADKQSLYSESDKVVILNATSLERAVVGSDNAWAVEFYNVYCGHCRHFAPTWKQIAKEVADWHPVIRLGVVACNDDANTPACRHFDIKAYPTIKLLPSNCRKDYTGEDYEGGMERTDLKKGLIDYVESYPVKRRPKACPKLEPLRSLDNIWNDVTANTKHTVVVFENDNSYLGRQLQLDMVLHKDQLVIRRMLQKDVIKFGVTKVPAMYLIDREGSFQKLVESDDDSVYKEKLYGLLGLRYTAIQLEEELRPEKEEGEGEGEGAGQGGEGGEGAAQGLQDSDRVDYRAAMAVHQQDLQSALHYSLRHEVAIHKVIEGESLTALKEYVTVLAEYFPGPDYTCRFLKLVNSWLKGLDTLTGEQWLHHINELQTSASHLPSSTTWTGCQGSSPRYRGYPCSLWMLFHTLTVNYVSQRPEELASRPYKVLTAMRGYIKTFFGCQECSKNFMKSAVHMEEKVNNADESVLFLWRSHNRANFFLKGDITEDSEHPKLQFPAKEMCPSCHVASDGKANWDEKEVVKFLQSMYAKENIVDDFKFTPFQKKPAADDVDDGWAKFKENVDLSKLSDAESRKDMSERAGKIKSALFGKNSNAVHQKADYAKSKGVELESRFSRMPVLTSWGFNRIDISMCVLFYLICMGIIVLVYYHFSGRRRKSRSLLPL